MTEPTESERAELNQRLARRQGHSVTADGMDAKAFVLIGPNGFRSLGAWSKEADAWQDAPNFTRDPAASRELVEWVAAQSRSVYYNFIYYLFQQGLGWSKERLLEETDFEEVIITALTAPPLLIAIAANAATKEER